MRQIREKSGRQHRHSDAERHFISPYYKIQWNGIDAGNLDLIFRIDKVEQCRSNARRRAKGAGRV